MIGMMTMILKNKSVKMLQFEHLSEERNISHFVTTRYGGFSSGNYASLNLSVYCGDNPQIVAENRRLLCDSLKISSNALYVPHQTHGAKVAVLDQVFLSKEKQLQLEILDGVDALLTNVANVCIAVTTADCVPLLLYAPDKQVVAAVHAGWRGTVARVAENLVQTMISRFSVHPSCVKVGIAPCISANAFEVGEEVVAAFRESGMDISRICRYNASTGKPHIDLVEANRLQLIESGVLSSNIVRSEICTYESSDFYSARKLGINSGRFLSGIMMTEKI
jgi:YfiH family protein